MNNQKEFIGMGKNPNPNVPDMPLGLGMALFQEPNAYTNFSNLTDQQKTSVIKYVQSNNVTGDDVERKITHAIDCLSKNSIEFFN